MERPYFGINLGSAEDTQRMLGDASLSALLNLGYSGIDNDQLQRYALQRQAALALAGQLHLPTPTQQELTEFLKTLRAFAGQNGEFDPQTYARFRDSLKTNSRMREGDVSRVVADDYRVRPRAKTFRRSRLRAAGRHQGAAHPGRHPLDARHRHRRLRQLQARHRPPPTPS